jgi:hypothetical protein
MGLEQTVRGYDFNAILLLEDADDMLVQLKSAITKLVDSSSDVTALNDIYTKLNQTHIQRLCEKISLVNKVVKDNLSTVTDAIMRAPGNFAEKENFLKHYADKNGYIKLDVMLEENTPHSFSDWIDGGRFAVDLFNSLSRNGDLQTSPAGPGEKAVAIFDPRVTWIGASEGGGDIAIGDTRVEIKAKVFKPGRWQDAGKAHYLRQNVADTMQSVGIDLTSKNSVTALDYLKNYFPTLTVQQRRAVAKSVVGNIFRFTDRTADLYEALVAGNFDEIKRQWAVASYYNYQATSKFSGILLLDYSNQTSLYFTDVANIAHLLRADAPQLWGPERDMMPKVAFVTK